MNAVRMMTKRRQKVDEHSFNTRRCHPVCFCFTCRWQQPCDYARKRWLYYRQFAVGNTSGYIVTTNETSLELAPKAARACLPKCQQFPVCLSVTAAAAALQDGRCLPCGMFWVIKPDTPCPWRARREQKKRTLLLIVHQQQLVVRAHRLIT